MTIELTKVSLIRKFRISVAKLYYQIMRQVAVYPISSIQIAKTKTVARYQLNIFSRQVNVRQV